MYPVDREIYARYCDIDFIKVNKPSYLVFSVSCLYVLVHAESCDKNDQAKNDACKVEYAVACTGIILLNMYCLSTARGWVV